MLIGGTKGSDFFEEMLCRSFELDWQLDWSQDNVVDPLVFTDEAWSAIYDSTTDTVDWDKRNEFTFKLAQQFEMELIGSHLGDVNNCPCDTTQDHILLRVLHPELSTEPVGMFFL